MSLAVALTGGSDRSGAARGRPAEALHGRSEAPDGDEAQQVLRPGKLPYFK